MTSSDFQKIFYSNFYPNSDWYNLEEIAWMYQNGMFKMKNLIISTHSLFEQTLELAQKGKIPVIKDGESDTHLTLKWLVHNFLVKEYNLKESDIFYEVPFIGFEVDVIDRNHSYPCECGDTNALKLEKYLGNVLVKDFYIVPYPHLHDVLAYQFCAQPNLFEYLDFKREHLLKRLRK